MSMEGALAFEAAAATLPVQLQAAMQMRNLRELDLVVAACKRTYLIFPERMPPSIERMLPKAQTMLNELKAQCVERFEELVDSAAGADATGDFAGSG